MDFDENLIEEVKKINFLYNLKSSDYKNVVKKEEAWKNIGEKLNSNGEACKKRWKNLRDHYKKVKQREEVRSGGAAPETKRPWKFYEMLLFLDGVQSSRRTYGNIAEEVVVEGGPIEEFEEFNELPGCSSNCAQSQETLDDSMCSTSTDNPRKRKKVDDVQDKFSNFFEKASASINSICKSYEESKQRGDGNTTRLLFNALESRIDNANLSAQQRMDLEINIASFVYQKLSEMQKK